MKQIQSECVARIPRHYVENDCLQIMIPHGINETVTILNPSDITYHYKENSPYFENQYLKDERRWNFPYSNIPTHIDRAKTRNVECVNQLLNFDQVYLEIIGGLIFERYACKDGDEALAAIKLLNPSLMDKKYMNLKEINELITSAKWVFDLDGTLRLNFTVPTEDILLECYRSWLINNIRNEQQLRKEQEMLKYGRTISNGLDDYFYHSIEGITVDTIPLNTPINQNIVLIKTDGHKFESVQAINIFYFGADNFKVEFYNYPITKYTLDHLKNIESLNGHNAGEPKIPRMLNPQIKHREIKKSKQLILKKTK